MAENTCEEIDMPLTNEILLDFENDPDIIEDKLPFKFDVKKKHLWILLRAFSFQDEEMIILFKAMGAEEMTQIFHFGISCLALFVQANFTGPPLDEETLKFLDAHTPKDRCRQGLIEHNEDINVNAKHCSLLGAAIAIFRNCRVNSIAKDWWLWRAYLVYQKILDEDSAHLLDMVEALEKELKTADLPTKLQALFELEQAQFFVEVRRIEKAEAHVVKVCDIMGLTHELYGRLGKRTHHQTEDIAQLTLQVTLEDKPDLERTEVMEHILPSIVTLNDDVRLDKLKFPTITQDTPLPDIEQKILLTFANYMIISRPMDGLFHEERRPYVEIIIAQKNTWAVRMATLLMRCQIESKHSRTIERSVMQAEELVGSLTKLEPPALNRIGGVFSTPLGPIWKTKEQYADLLLNLGLVKAALEIYLELQHWEEVVVCYTILKLRHKAAEVIQQQLDEKPTVKLWCILGDAIDDPKCYETAWEFSKKRSHLAQRHWGHYFFARKQFAECIPHYEKSVSINPLQAVVWIRLGFAALETENWQTAATAYRRYTTLEPNSYEAWNNLAKAYIKLNNQQNAYRALKDALRCNYDNWKIWENFLVVSTHLKLWHDSLYSYHRLIELKGNYLDTPILRSLVNGVIENREKDKRLLKKMRELLGRITAANHTSGDAWELYASLSPVPSLEVQRLQRAYTCYTHGNWWSNEESRVKVLILCLKLGDACLSDSAHFYTLSVRLNISAALAVLKKQEVDSNKALLQQVTAMLVKVIEKCKLADAAGASQPSS